MFKGDELFKDRVFLMGKDSLFYLEIIIAYICMELLFGMICLKSLRLN